MFTGIITGAGNVKLLSFSGGAARLLISAKGFWDDTGIGDSISVDGVCLTIVQKSGDDASFDVSLETLKRSIMGGYKPAVNVNLEKALRPMDRLGGHFVQGHVDGAGKYIGTQKTGENVLMSFEIPQKLSAYVVEKGSITINGISLTAASVNGNVVKVALIPHTLKLTNLSELKAGSPVNIECDIIARYTEKLLLSHRKGEVDLELLKRNGFA